MTTRSTEETGRTVGGKINQAEAIKLFLDYDGTLAEFAPTPDHVLPDHDLIRLLRALCQTPKIELVILSGRRLQHIERLVPIDELWRAGSYGIEIINPQGELIERVNFREIRPQLELVKPQWQVLIDGIDGFFLEDKGWSLALHARDVDPDIGAQIVFDAQNILHECQLGNQYRVLGGDRFLEVGPIIANKGLAVQYLVDSNQWQGSLLIYIGDDDKDEEAFEIIHQYGGITIKINRDGGDTSADSTLRDPNSVREWLKNQFLM